MTAIPDRSTFEDIYADQPPWDIGKPQRALLGVAERIAGRILLPPAGGIETCDLVKVGGRLEGVAVERLAERAAAEEDVDRLLLLLVLVGRIAPGELLRPQATERDQEGERRAQRPKRLGVG